MQVQFMDVAGTRTRFLTAGDPAAYPLLLLHGYGGTADVWIRNIDVLGDEFHVVAVDMIGQGFTDPVDFGEQPPQPATVRHLQNLCDKLGWKKFCPIGTSYGSLIGALLYFEMPDRVDRLVINGSANCFNTDADLRAAMERVLVNFGPLMAAPTVEGCRAAMMKQAYDPKSVPEEILLTMATAYAQPGVKIMWERGAHGLMNVEACRPHRILHRLDKLDVDTLVIWGREDPGARYENAVAAVGQMPRAQLVTFEKCGHKPMFEYPQRFNDVIRNFLRRGRSDGQRR